MLTAAQSLRSTTLTGGMITPSWNTSRNAPMLAGAPPLIVSVPAL